jgi:4-amino-4-deoxy-L-arabinose transferase-like glycosyltransferase
MILVLLVLLVPVAVAGASKWWEHDSLKADVLFLLTFVPPIAFLIAFMSMGTSPDWLLWGPLLVAAVECLAIIVVTVAKHPKASLDVVAAVGWGAMAYEGTRKYQGKRDRERAEAVVDELERRR